MLVFSKTAGFVHNSIPEGIAAIQKLGAENGFDVDTTKNAAWFQEDSLKKYAAGACEQTYGYDNKKKKKFFHIKLRFRQFRKI